MKKKILVIEDHPDWRGLLCCYLGSLGYQMTDAENGLDGMETAMRESPELIILDLGLPDVSGIQVAILLSQDPKTRHIPILVHSAWPADLWREKAIQAGAAEYLAKPAPLPFLADTIKRLLANNLDSSPETVDRGHVLCGPVFRNFAG